MYQSTRNRKGKPFLDFLMATFDTLGVPNELNKGDSPLKRNLASSISTIPIEQSLQHANSLENVKRISWVTDKKYIDFRLDESKDHRHCNFTELQHCGLIEDPVEKQRASKSPRLSEESQQSQNSNSVGWKQNTVH